MRKLYTILLFTVSLTGNAQGAVQKITRDYFRSDPFTSEFSVFLKHLINDPTIKDKVVIPRTDTNLFYMHGVYTTHNPFFFKPQKVNISLTEIEIKYVDSLPDKDTIMLYELVVISENDPDGLKDVKKEFEKLHQRFKKGFDNSTYKEARSATEQTSEWHNYFFKAYAVAPVSILWMKPEDSNETALDIIIRLKVNYNQAVLPAPYLPDF